MLAAGAGVKALAPARFSHTEMKKQKRRYKTAPNYSIFFDRMENGTLRVDIDTGVVEIFHRGEWKQPHINVDDEGYRFVEIYHNGHRKRCGVARLVWMVANGQEYVPAGYDIDHEDDDNTNNCHLNLSLKTIQENRSNRASFRRVHQPEQLNTPITTLAEMGLEF